MSASQYASTNASSTLLDTATVLHVCARACSPPSSIHSTSTRTDPTSCVPSPFVPCATSTSAAPPAPHRSPPEQDAGEGGADESAP